MQYR